MPTYLVERYWPGVTPEQLLKALDRGRRVIKEMGAEGTRIQDISCTLIPAEEIVFSIYEGSSASAIREFNERANIPLSRASTSRFVEIVLADKPSSPYASHSFTAS